MKNASTELVKRHSSSVNEFTGYFRQLGCSARGHSACCINFVANTSFSLSNLSSFQPSPWPRSYHCVNARPLYCRATTYIDSMGMNTEPESHINRKNGDLRSSVARATPVSQSAQAGLTCDASTSMRVCVRMPQWALVACKCGPGRE